MEILTQAFIISQILVFLALISDILSFQFKKRKTVLIFLAISSFLIMMHYFFLNEIIAGILLLFSFSSYVVATKSTSKKWLYFFLIITIIPLVLMYSSWTDILIFVGIYLAIIARFQENDKNLRKILMIATTIIIIYNMIIFTPLGVLLEAIFLTSNIVGYYRHYIRKKKIK